MEDFAATRSKGFKRIVFITLTLIVLLVAFLIFFYRNAGVAPRMELHLVQFDRATNGLLTAVLQITNSGKRDLWLVPRVAVSYNAPLEIIGYDPIRGGTLAPGAVRNIVIRPTAGLKCRALIIAHPAWRVRVANLLTQAKISPAVIKPTAVDDWLGSDQVQARTDWIETPLLPQMSPLR